MITTTVCMCLQIHRDTEMDGKNTTPHRTFDFMDIIACIGVGGNVDLND